MRYLFCLLSITLFSMSRTPPPIPSISGNIGVHTEQYTDTKRKRPVVVEMWYPTDISEPFDNPEDPVWVHPDEVRDVPPTEGKFPLIIMSHGHFGDRRDRSWLVEHLVKNGFIVVSVEHHGNSWRSYNPVLSLRFWERARDVSFVITQLLKDPFLRNHIDPHRIGFVGYSLGGMTGLALGGAKAQNVREIIKRYEGTIPELAPEIVEKIDFSEAHGNFTDKRIKALVLLSPATFIFPNDTFKNIKAPVALVASEGDEILPFQDHALKIIQHLSPKKLKVLREKASHYVFLNRVSPIGKTLMRQELQTDQIQSDRLTVHKEVGEFVTSFFQEHL